ncbi:MAG: cbb3-type cytochrome c oxidase subunit 3 [Gammaproteobacteria bacterium]|nr:cbb3-type cytochrome c oxidase subunit 3 [Gammaproteobacteria bacterium]
MNLATFHSWWTVLMFVLFVGIIAWAWSGRRKRAFDAAARLPLEDDDSHVLPLSPPSRGEGSLTPTPLPLAGEGSSVRSEPSALRATSFTRGEKKHG